MSIKNKSIGIELPTVLIGCPENFIDPEKKVEIINLSESPDYDLNEIIDKYNKILDRFPYKFSIEGVRRTDIMPDIAELCKAKCYIIQPVMPKPPICTSCFIALAKATGINMRTYRKCAKCTRDKIGDTYLAFENDHECLVVSDMVNDYLISFKNNIFHKVFPTE